MRNQIEERMRTELKNRLSEIEQAYKNGIADAQGGGLKSNEQLKLILRYGNIRIVDLKHTQEFLEILDKIVEEIGLGIVDDDGNLIMGDKPNPPEPENEPDSRDDAQDETQTGEDDEIIPPGMESPTDGQAPKDSPSGMSNAIPEFPKDNSE